MIIHLDDFDPQRRAWASRVTDTPESFRQANRCDPETLAAIGVLERGEATEVVVGGGAVPLARLRADES